jgi:hypothetical protein
MKPRPDARPQWNLGSVRSDEVMPSREFCRRLGVSAKAWRAMLQRGLKAPSCGKQRFVLGSDAVAFFANLAEQQATVAAGGDGEGNGR